VNTAAKWFVWSAGAAMAAYAVVPAAVLASGKRVG